jgi:glycosyltransferase involved in cell wall biosynthesis
MAATISVVVPTYNSGSVIGQCLASINQQSYRPLNVVVCDGGSTDNTVEIASSLGATVWKSVASRSAQRNAGAKQSSADFVLFVDSDMRLTRSVLENCIETFRETDAALVVPEVDIGTSYWAKVRGFERSFYRDAWWLKAARCYRTAEFHQIGGFDVGLIGAEDWDLDERIRRFGGVREISSTIEHDEGNVSFRKLIQKKGHYAQSFPEFERRHPARAKKCFSKMQRLLLIMRQPGRIVSHPVLASGLVCLGISEVLVSQGWLKTSQKDQAERPLDSSEPSA